ncbi:MAG TPA: NUDIX domain-containing protein [Candidatus Sulfotelmatobacter sp.]|nr:NUDIX domain-containing protein [Candidatus Sulfotelmatobacter sp.]
MKNIIYVDENDEVIGSGSMDKARSNGITVRIVRIFLVNDQGQVLLQKRSDSVRTNPGQWDQAAGGHVDEGDSYEEAAERELKEEMGISDVPLEKLTKYFAVETDDPPYVKKRFNMLFEGKYSGKVIIDDEEVSNYKWVSINELKTWVEKSPADFPEGFKQAFKKYLEYS